VVSPACSSDIASSASYAPVQIGYKPHHPTPSQHRPTSTGVRADERPFRPLKPWPALSQPHYISNRSPVQTKTCPRRAGRSPGWPATSEALVWVGWTGVASRRSPPRATTRRPGDRANRGRRRPHRGLPPDRRAVGLRQIDGMPHELQRARSALGPSSGRRTSRSIEKPGEVVRAFSWSTLLHHPVGADGEVQGGRAGL
jgi:hypothetical protein